MSPRQIALIVEALAIAEAELRTQGTAPGVIDTSAGDALTDKADAMDELRQSLMHGGAS